MIRGWLLLPLQLFQVKLPSTHTMKSFLVPLLVCGFVFSAPSKCGSPSLVRCNLKLCYYSSSTGKCQGEMVCFLNRDPFAQIGDSDEVLEPSSITMSMRPMPRNETLELSAITLSTRLMPRNEALEPSSTTKSTKPTPRRWAIYHPRRKIVGSCFKALRKCSSRSIHHLR
jgi:hypothetical protein